MGSDEFRRRIGIKNQEFCTQRLNDLCESPPDATKTNDTNLATANGLPFTNFLVCSNHTIPHLCRIIRNPSNQS